MIKTAGNNSVYVSDRIQGEVKMDHFLYDEAFFSVTLAVPRLSGAVDCWPLTIPGRLIQGVAYDSASVRVCGQLRSYNKHTDTGNRLMLTVLRRKWKNAARIGRSKTRFILKASFANRRCSAQRRSCAKLKTCCLR